MTPPLPTPFQQQMQLLLGAEYPAFVAALLDPAPVSLRKNPLKTPRGEGSNFSETGPVPWHPQGVYLSERPVFTLDPLLHAGAYYVQEASSMFLFEALRQLVDQNAALNVLDLCAAPGGKSSLLLSALPHSLVVSNEVIRSRTAVLRENLERWGSPNTAVTSAEAEDFSALENWFDLILTDAPCSGEGLFRKDPEARKEWSPAHVDLCAARQKRILSGAVAALRPGGILAYSTCTYNLQENEENAVWLCQEFGLEPVTLQIPEEWGIVRKEMGYQFFPHQLRGEGFFLALFRKSAGPEPSHHAPSGFRSLQPLPKKMIPELAPWFHSEVHLSFFQIPNGDVLALPEEHEQGYRLLDKALKNKWFGLHAGTFKGKDFIPNHALALSTACSPTLPAVDFSREQALRFLKKEVFDLPADAPDKGWALARHQGLNLGWLKILPNRWNNYLPNERRIRMELS